MRHHLYCDCPARSSVAENNKDSQYQKVKVKAEPMEVDPPAAELASPASHLLPFSTLGASEKKEPMTNLPETLACPQKDLFSQDISVKMASELLFKLSGMLVRDVSCAHTHTHMVLRGTADARTHAQRHVLPPSPQHRNVNLGKFLIRDHKSDMLPFKLSGGFVLKSRIHDTK